jgi:hypothetical protein
MDSFFERPILNSPYAYPGQHWELDEDGQPTNRIVDTRRRSELITPVPKPQRRRRSPNQAGFLFDSGEGLSTEEQEYNPTPIINEIRGYVNDWRRLPNPDQWQVSPKDRAAAAILATSSVPGHPPVLLRSRGRRDGHLADRGRAEARRRRCEVLGAPPRGQRAVEPRAAAHRIKNGYWVREDFGDGDADRVADG